MNIKTRISELQTNSYRGCRLLSATSCLFLVASAIQFARQRTLLGLVMLIVFINSIFYHTSGDPVWRKVDQFTNFFVVGLPLFIWALYNSNYGVVGIAFVMIEIYLLNCAGSPQDRNFLHAILHLMVIDALFLM